MLKKFNLTILLATLVISLGTHYSQSFPIPEGWISNTGNEISCKGCEETYFSDNDLLTLKRNGKYEFINTKDSSFKSKTYDYLTTFNEGYAMAKAGSNWLIIDSLDQQIAEVKCHYGHPFSGGLARIQLGNRFAYINSKGERVIDLKYYGAYDFSEGMARVYFNNKWGFINTKGEEVTGFKFDYAWDFTNGKASTMTIGNRKENWSFIDAKGNKGKSYDYIFPFSDDLALVRVGEFLHGKLSFINLKEEKVIELNYQDAFPFSDGLSCVLKDGKWGYIDTTGSEVIPCQFDGPANFKSGLALVNVNSKKRYINVKGETVWSE